MIKKWITIIAAAACTLPYAEPLRAQWPNPAEMEIINPDARSAGMADIGSATAPDAFSQHWNVAKYAFAVDTGAVGLSYSPWMWGAQNFSSHLVYLAGYYRIGSHNLSASIRYMSNGTTEYRSDASVSAGSSSLAQLAVDLGYSHAFGKYFSTGIAFRYLSLPVTDAFEGGAYLSDRAGAFAVDVGFYFRYPSSEKNEFALGLSLKDIGTKVDIGGDKQFLPMAMNLGSRYSFAFAGKHELAFAIDINKPLVPKDQTKSVFGGFFASFENNFKEWGLSAGAEYNYLRHYFLRTGYHLGSVDYRYAAGSYWSIGAGAKWQNLSFDLSYLLSTSANLAISNTVRIGMQYSF
jgi:hypothetical protein